MAKTISVMIYNKTTNKYEDITNSIVSDITLDERLDEVLDSGTFSFLSEEFTTAIEPFTRCHIMFGSGGGFFFCSSTCNKYLTKEGLYYHEVQCYEPTKYLECLIVGTKAFSIIDGQSNYNTNYDRIRILVELMNSKYGINIDISKLKVSDFAKEREYSFGAGTTLWDALSEIMSTENAIPRLTFSDTATSVGLDKFTLTCDFIKGSNYTYSIGDITKLETTQSVDEYCSEMETELAEVVDRDTLQSCYLTVRSQSDVICEDSACLIAPSNIESVESLTIKFEASKEAMGTKATFLLKEDVDKALNLMKEKAQSSTSPGFHIRNGVYMTSFFKGGETQNYSFLYALQQIDSDNTDSTFEHLHWWLNVVVGAGDDDINWNTANTSVNEGWLYIMVAPVSTENMSSDVLRLYNDYYLCVYVDEYGFANGSTYLNEMITYTWNETIDIANKVLPKEQWDLLDETERPLYLYYQSGSNYIEGFNNVARDGFWESLIYGSVGPFLNGIKSSIADYDNECQFYWDMIDFEKVIDRQGKLCYLDNLPLYQAYNSLEYAFPRYDEVMSFGKYTDLIYHLKYYTKSPAYFRTNKSTYNCQLKTARSYNNGANTIDYNLLVPSVQRAVDMQGLPITTIYSKSQSDIQVGAKTQYGYVISKQSTFRRTTPYENVESFVYNCCSNIEQLAAAIGVSSQYEATNLPQTGIVDRYIYLTTTYNLEKEDLGYGLYFRITNPANKAIMKPVQKLHVDGKNLYVCECVDNHTFDYQKKSTSVDNYYLKNAIPYADDNNYLKTISTCSFARWHSSVTPTLDYLNELPYINGYWFVFATYNDVVIYKDPRERLIFVVEKK